jgi:hypothetical protein
MAFVKVGDAEKINAFFDEDKVVICSKCGKILDTLQISADQNAPICTCEKDDEQ